MRIFFNCIVLLLCFISDMNGQSSSWACCHHWSAGDPINIFQPIPVSPAIKSCAGQGIDFTIRMNDFDKATCPKGMFRKQFPTFDYRFNFSSSTSDALFSNGMTTMTVGIYAEIWQPNPYCPGTDFALVISESAHLDINGSWSGTPFTICVTIDDIPGSLPSCHTGNAMDPSKVFCWTVTSTSVLPTSLIRSTTTPADGSWVTAPVDFTYEGKPHSPPAYQDLTIAEEFPIVDAGGIFALSDLLPSWLALHPGATTADIAAGIIFATAEPATFLFDVHNEFTDTHAGFPLSSSAIASIFKPTAIALNHVGYRIKQEYKVCGTLIGHAFVSRRFISSSGSVEVMKIHVF